jgi:DNA-binding PadR family transcriptional regulator
MSSKYSLGKFEEVVLLTVAVLHGNAYGVAIKEEIEHRLKRNVSLGAMRAALRRLEVRGFLQSVFGEVTALRDGKRKRYHSVAWQKSTRLRQLLS